MFDFFTDVIENAFDVTDSFLSGEEISKRKIASLISAGLTVASIASITGIAEEVITKYLED